MSKIIKNSDVEDVLFSIKRLVSDKPESKAAPEDEPVVDDMSGALILTSALRVNDPATEPEQIDLEDMTKGLPHFRDAVSREDGDGEDYPSLDEVFSGTVDASRPRRLNLSEVTKEAASEDGEASNTAELNAAPLTDEYFEDEDTGDFALHNWTKDPDVETLSDFATEKDTFGDDAKPTPIKEPALLSAEMVAEDWPSAANENADASDSDLVATAETTSGVDETSNAAEVPVLEERVAETPIADEPLEAGATDGLADFDENILDEDALRDMVTEIVRDELSGDLGERITRNVRKLVRREIHRAMMTREFD